jgi:hypothetical protein
MSGAEFLDGIARDSRPPDNMSGASLDCFQCRESVGGAHYDGEKRTLTWFCSKNHKSQIKDFEIG